MTSQIPAPKPFQLRVLGFGLLKRGEHLRWYVMTLGGEIDYHTPIGTGNVINIDKHLSDICSLLPTQFIAVDRGCCENRQALVLELHIAGYLGLVSAAYTSTTLQN